MPCSEFSRAATASLASIWLTRKCLPMSRRKSIADSGAVQSRLLTMTAAFVALEVQERLDLGADALHPVGDDLRGRSACARRSASGRRSARCAADERQRPVPGLLEPPQR